MAGEQRRATMGAQQRPMLTAMAAEPDPFLASGQQLPPALVRQMPPELVGKPIEDIDLYYADQEVSRQYAVAYDVCVYMLVSILDN